MYAGGPWNQPAFLLGGREGVSRFTKTNAVGFSWFLDAWKLNSSTEITPLFVLCVSRRIDLKSSKNSATF